jgi:hypothetical protein
MNNIKNYTSGVNHEATINRIEMRLAAAGASGIMKLYNDRKEVAALVFEIRLGERNFRIKVPANVDACFEAMWKEHCLRHTSPRESTKATIRDQAHRTAWKLVQDWIDVQISMIVMRQAEFLEVFLPYIWDGKQTFFTAMKGSGFKQLAERTE